LQGQCKTCANTYKAENLSVISAGKRALGAREREEIRAYKASPEYKARRNAKRRERTATDPLWRARKSVMDMWSRFLSGGSDTHLERWGCTRKEFWAHIATTFQPGMTIENYREAWEIDHIWPTSRASEHPDPDFNVWHYSNTQALTTRQNSQKKNRTPEEYTQFLKEVEQHGI
jgi:5-methylcytosine-specific restriction endonuclease McrA